MPQINTEQMKQQLGCLDVNVPPDIDYLQVPLMMILKRFVVMMMMLKRMVVMMMLKMMTLSLKMMLKMMVVMTRR